MLNKQEWISYDLAKKVPDMRRGFRIETNYGEICTDPARALERREGADRRHATERRAA